MLDGNHTTVDWQTNATDILVLPVGAFEQHSVHLPLDTDNIQGDFFGRMVAEALDAALLPTIRITTSMEHTGHRGSFSLRPETLMRVVRDIADDAARQGFRIMIVANAHGGNHCLVPVCRDINRRDGALKIILVNYWEYRDPALIFATEGPGMNFHANADETSILMRLRPDLVGTARADADYSAAQLDLVQSDLTTFGVGHLNPSGAIGWPSLATPDRGQALIDSVRERLIPHLRTRIERLRKQWHYAGPGGFALRPLHPADVPDGMRLKHLAGWNQTEQDWAMLLAAGGDGCLAMVHQGRVVGTVTTTPYGATAWIGMVLVDPAHRGMGLATRLMEGAMAHLAHVPSVRLDATDAGRLVYARMGFRDACTLSRLVCPAVPHQATASAPAARPMQAADLDGVLALDLTRFGADRQAVLRSLWNAEPDRAFVLERDGTPTAYAFGRRGSQWHQVGPIAAENTQDAAAVAGAALGGLRGLPVLLDVPLSQTAFLEHLGEAGFREQRRFTRMVFGDLRPLGQDSTLFASGGPEIG